MTPERLAEWQKSIEAQENNVSQALAACIPSEGNDKEAVLEWRLATRILLIRYRDFYQEILQGSNDNDH